MMHSCVDKSEIHEQQLQQQQQSHRKNVHKHQPYDKRFQATAPSLSLQYST